jgi:hypothetical protein
MLYVYTDQVIKTSLADVTRNYRTLIEVTIPEAPNISPLRLTDRTKHENAKKYIYTHTQCIHILHIIYIYNINIHNIYLSIQNVRSHAIHSLDPRCIPAIHRQSRD